MTVVIVGGGLAGGTAATELRESGYDGRLVLFAGEPHLPYERPPLSNGFLLGKDPIEEVF
ncbi:MAG TPA: FAD-dependent oxidoreductase, partial [Nocardioidaceae bacterium]|nr:FAD-dependent oxidoreductase [Nocardioidaceae bacterium]